MFSMTGKGARIRRAATEDATSVASVLRQAFGEYEPVCTKQGYVAITPERATIVTRLQEGPIWVALDGEHIVGTVSVVRRKAE